MVYKTQNYWVSGLCTSSGILNTRKHNGPPKYRRGADNAFKVPPPKKGKFNAPPSDGGRATSLDG
jgi:hypothetical protein